MKITISFELDLANTDYDDAGVNCVHRVSDWLADFHKNALVCVMNAYFDSKDMPPEAAKLYIDWMDEKTKLTEQIFHNIEFKGVTDNGQSFVFTHKEPGYKEQWIIDGVPVDSPYS